MLAGSAPLARSAASRSEAGGGRGGGGGGGPAIGARPTTPLNMNRTSGATMRGRAKMRTRCAGCLAFAMLRGLAPTALPESMPSASSAAHVSLGLPSPADPADSPASCRLSPMGPAGPTARGHAESAPRTPHAVPGIARGGSCASHSAPRNALGSWSRHGSEKRMGALNAKGRGRRWRNGEGQDAETQGGPKVVRVGGQ